MKRRRKTPEQIRQAVGGVPRGWYERITVAKKACGGCAKGEPCPACKAGKTLHRKEQNNG